MTSIILPNGVARREIVVEPPAPPARAVAGPHIRWSAILLGALLAVALQIPIMFLGAGIGLATLNIRSPTLDTGSSIAGSVFAGITMTVAFAAGGWAASYFARPDRRGAAVLHGLATWAVVAAAGVLLVGTQMVSALGGLLQAAGVGVASAASADTALDQLARMNLQLVSNFDLVEGTVVSRLVAAKPVIAPSDEIVAEAKEKAEKLSPAKNPETRALAEDARDVSAAGSFVVAAALLLSALGAVGGALQGRPRRA